MLLPLSLHKYHPWAAPDAVELQLQVLSEKFDFIQQEVHVLSADLRADNHLAEEVDFAPVRLVPKHHAALLHHPLLNYRSNLKVDTKKRLMSRSEIQHVWAGSVFCGLKSFSELSEFCAPCLSSPLPAPRKTKLIPAGLKHWDPWVLYFLRELEQDLNPRAWGIHLWHGKGWVKVPSLPDLDQRFELRKNISCSWLKAGFFSLC